MCSVFKTKEHMLNFIHVTLKDRKHSLSRKKDHNALWN